MNLDFLDNGLPVEYGNEKVVSNEILSFLKYCKSINKKPQELTEDELKTYHESC